MDNTPQVIVGLSCLPTAEVTFFEQPGHMSLLIGHVVIEQRLHGVSVRNGFHALDLAHHSF